MKIEANEVQINGVIYIPKGSETRLDVSTDGLPYVVVRSRDQGVMVGYLVEQTDHVVTLRRARQVWSWQSRFVLAEFAELGPTDPGKMSCELSGDFQLAGWCGIYPCTEAAGAKIREIAAHVP